MSISAPSGAEPQLFRTLAPLPTTRRGYGIHVNVSPASVKEPRMLYTNGRLVLLRSLADPNDTIVFSEHKANVNVAVFAPSGYFVASGDEEGNVIIWSFPSLKVKSQFKVGKTVLDLDWDESSTRLVSAGDGAQRAKAFSWDSGNNIGELGMHTNQVISCSFRKQRPYRIATSSEDLAVNFYEGPPFKYSQAYKGHARYPNCVRFSPDGEYFVTVGSDSKIVVFDGKTAEVKKEIDDKQSGHKGAIYAFAWGPDSKHILTASADKTAKIINIESGEVVTTFTFGSTTNDMQVGALWSGDYLVTVSLSGAINYLDRANPTTPSRILHGHQSTIQSIALDVERGVFYTSGLTGEVTQWNRETGASKWLTGKGHDGKVVSVLNTTKDGKLLSFGLDNKVLVSDPQTGAFGTDAAELGGSPVAAVTSTIDPSLTLVVTGREQLQVLRNGQVATTLALGFAPTCVTFSSDHTQVYVGGKDKKLHVYTIDGDAVKAGETITTHDKPLTSVRVSPSGEYVVSTDLGASIYIHTTSAAHELKNKSGWRFHQAAVQDADWSPSSDHLITVSLDCNIIVWRQVAQFSAGSRVQSTLPHSVSIDAVRWWDATSFITYGGDKVIKVWNVLA